MSKKVFFDDRLANWKHVPDNSVRYLQQFSVQPGTPISFPKLVRLENLPTHSWRGWKIFPSQSKRGWKISLSTAGEVGKSFLSTAGWKMEITFESAAQQLSRWRQRSQVETFSKVDTLTHKATVAFDFSQINQSLLWSLSEFTYCKCLISLSFERQACKELGGPLWPVWHICRDRRDVSCRAILGPEMPIHWIQWLAHNIHTLWPLLLLVHIVMLASYSWLLENIGTLWKILVYTRVQIRTLNCKKPWWSGVAQTSSLTCAFIILSMSTQCPPKLFTYTLREIHFWFKA